MTGAAYIRVSTEDQLEFSPDSQLKKIREYADQHQITIPEDQIYLDEGISGRSASKRPAFMRMIASARSHPAPFQVILVWKFSRFARNRQDSILYKSMLRRECGIEVISVSEPLSDDPTSILVEALLEAMDEYYSLNLAEEVRRGMNEKFSRGQTVSIPPFGYRMGDTKFEPEETTAPFVPLIFQKFCQGVPIRGIASWLNHAGIRTSRENLFESRTVEYILSNPVYTGKLRRRFSHQQSSRDRFYQDPEVQVVPASHTPLVSQELFDAAQKRLSFRRKYFSSSPVQVPSATPSVPRSAASNSSATRCAASHSSAPMSERPSSLFRGLVRCSSCQSLLLSTAHGTALQCGSYTKGRCFFSHYISLKLLKASVLQALRECPLSLKGDSIPMLLPVQMDPPFSSADALIQTAKKRLERLRAAYEAGTDTLEEYQERKTELLEQITALKETKKEEQEVSVSSCSSFSWNYYGLLCLLDSGILTGTEANELLRLMLSRILFNRPEGSLQLIFRF